jgi:hypothetical protein
MERSRRRRHEGDPDGFSTPPSNATRLSPPPTPPTPLTCCCSPTASGQARLGTARCRRQPNTADGNTGLTEDFGTHGNFAILLVDVDDLVSSCGRRFSALDAEEISAT